MKSTKKTFLVTCEVDIHCLGSLSGEKFQELAVGHLMDVNFDKRFDLDGIDIASKCVRIAEQCQENPWEPAETRVEDAYEVIANTDTNEGRGRDYVCNVALSEGSAKFLAKGKGVMGSEAAVKGPVKILRVRDSEADRLVLDYKDVFSDNDCIQEEKEAALSKLTDREKEILGLSDES